MLTGAALGEVVLLSSPDEEMGPMFALDVAEVLVDGVAMGSVPQDPAGSSRRPQGPGGEEEPSAVSGRPNKLQESGREEAASVVSGRSNKPQESGREELGEEEEPSAVSGRSQGTAAGVSSRSQFTASDAASGK